MSKLPVRFETKIERTDTCWLWMGATNSKGYGCWAVDGVSQLAHRVAYELMVRQIPEGLTIDHLCRNKLCVNPAHLEAVTLRENIARAYEQDKPSHCPQGHEYSPENTYLNPRPSGRVNRICRKCAYQATKRNRAKNRAAAKAAA